MEITVRNIVLSSYYTAIGGALCGEIQNRSTQPYMSWFSNLAARFRGNLAPPTSQDGGHELAMLRLRSDENTNGLGNKSFEATQIYLDSAIHDPEEQRKLDQLASSNPSMESGRKFSTNLVKAASAKEWRPKIQPELNAVPLPSRLRRRFVAGLQFSGDLYLAATHLHCPFPRCKSRLLD